MKRRRWDSGIKTMIVVQGLKGRPVAEICIEHQISQAQYYQWRDQFMTNLPMCSPVTAVGRKLWPEKMSASRRLSVS